MPQHDIISRDPGILDGTPLALLTGHTAHAYTLRNAIAHGFEQEQ